LKKLKGEFIRVSNIIGLSHIEKRDKELQEVLSKLPDTIKEIDEILGLV
jgi:hypothetical protein